MVWDATIPAVTTQLVASPNIFNTNQTAIQSVLTTTNLTASIPYIPTSAPMFIYAAAAPTGWTLQAGLGDRLLAVAGGVSQYNVAGGTQAGTWNGPGEQIKLTELPIGNNVNVAGGGAQIYKLSFFPQVLGAAHSHDWTTTRPQANVGIICTKDP